MTARIVRGFSLVLVGVTALALAACASSSSSSRTAKARKKSDASNYNMQLGMAYLNQGELGLAKQKLERAVKENPDDPNVHSAMAMLQDRLGHPQLADKEFQAALNLGTRSPDVLNNYAVYLCRTGRVDEGVKSFEEAARNPLYRTPEAAYTNAGVCLRGARRDTQAAMSFQRALQIRPNFAEAAYQLADLDFQRGEVQEARETVDRFVSAFEPTPDLLLVGVRISRKQGDRVAEERFARKLRMDFPSSDQARALAELSHNPG
jgi:type IV pilus assembly protein PilF